MSWPLVTLGELSKHSGQYGVGLSSREWKHGDPRYIRITDIGDDGRLNGSVVAPDGDASDWGNAVLREGDLLFARSGATVGKTYLHGADAPTSVYAGYLIRFQLDTERVLPGYAFRFTQSPAYRTWVASTQRAVAQPNINAKQYASLPIPLPPLDEQRRIAAILDQADVVHTASTQRLNYLDKLSQSAFATLAIGDGGVQRLNLGDLIEVRSSLVDPKKAEYREMPHIGPHSIKSGSSRIEGWRTVGADGVTSGKHEFNAGDILYSKIRPNLNKVAIARFDGLCSADMYAIKVRENLATPEFVEFSLRSPQFLAYADSLSNRANIPKLNRNQLEAFPVAVPPLDRQQQFVERLGAIRRCADQVELSIALGVELKAALQFKAFGGIA